MNFCCVPRVVNRNNIDHNKQITFMNTPPNFIVFVPKSMRDGDRKEKLFKINDHVANCSTETIKINNK